MKNSFCGGPFWILHWKKRQRQERFENIRINSEIKSEKYEICGCYV